MAPFISNPADLRVVNLLRRCIQGTEPWIHHANPYGGDPVSLTAAYPPATAAEDGDTASYFLHTPQKKEGSDLRMSRTAGAGTWKGERTFPVYAPKKEGGRVQVGFKETYSYILQKKTASQREVRLGWIMHSFRLMDEEDSQGRCLSRVFPTPRRSDAPVLVVLNPVPLRVASPIAAAGTTSDSVHSAAAAATILSTKVGTATGAAPTTLSATGTSPTTIAVSATATSTGTSPSTVEATGTSPSTVEAKATAPSTVEATATRTTPPSSTSFATAVLPITAGEATTPIEPATAASTTTDSAPAASETTTEDSAAVATTDSATEAATPSTASAATPSTASAATSSTSATTAAATSAAAAATDSVTPASPPKKWLQVLISDSPTKSSDKKRIYQVMLPVDQSEVHGLQSSKKMRRIECKGWLKLEPSSTSNIQIL